MLYTAKDDSLTLALECCIFCEKLSRNLSVSCVLTLKSYLNQRIIQSKIILGKSPTDCNRVKGQYTSTNTKRSCK